MTPRHFLCDLCFVFYWLCDCFEYKGTHSIFCITLLLDINIAVENNYESYMSETEVKMSNKKE